MPARALPHAHALELHVAQHDAVQVKRHVGAHAVELLLAQPDGVAALLDGGKYVLLEVFVAAQLGARHIEQRQLLALEVDGAVLVKEYRHVLVPEHALLHAVLERHLQRLLVVVVLLEQALPLIGGIGAHKLGELRRDEEVVAHDVVARLAIAQAALVLAAAQVLHHAFVLYGFLVHAVLCFLFIRPVGRSLLR